MAMYALFTPIDQHLAVTAQINRGYILDVVEKLRTMEDGEFKDSLCRSLHESIAELCASAPEDAICVDRAMWIERAGC